MSIIYKNGNLLDSECDYICHQVNCRGVMGSGVALAIKRKWPIVFDKYVEKYNEYKEIRSTLLGSIQIVNISSNNKEQFVINMFSQLDYGYDGKRYTSYDAFWNCINLIKHRVPKGKTIAFPKYIGSNRGGANWTIISTMIAEALGEDFDVYFYYLEENNNDKK